MEYGKIVSEGLRGWWKKPKAIRYGLFVFFASLAFSLFSTGIGALLFGSLEKYIQFFFGLDNANASPADFSVILAFFVASFLLGFAFFIILRIIEGKLLREAMLARRPVPSFDTEKGLRFVVLGIASSVAALFCWYNKKWLLLLLGCLIGVVLLAVGVASKNWMAVFAGALLALALGLAYLIVTAYNSVRLALADLVFVEKNQSIGSALRESRKISDKKAFRVFIAFFVVGLVGFVLIFLVFLVSMLLSVAASFSAGLQWPAFLLSLLTGAILNALLLLITAFAAVEVYAQVLREPLAEK